MIASKGAVVLNSKMRRTGVCGAAETLLIDRAVPVALTTALIAALRDAGCEVRGDEALRALVPDTSIKPATLPAAPDPVRPRFRSVQVLSGEAERVSTNPSRGYPADADVRRRPPLFGDGL